MFGEIEALWLVNDLLKLHTRPSHHAVAYRIPACNGQFSERLFYSGMSLLDWLDGSG